MFLSEKFDKGMGYLYALLNKCEIGDKNRKREQVALV
jgi:hypothetical protein